MIVSGPGREVAVARPPGSGLGSWMVLVSLVLLAPAPRVAADGKGMEVLGSLLGGRRRMRRGAPATDPLQGLSQALGAMQGAAGNPAGGANPQLQQLMSLLGGLQGQAPAAGGGANPQLQQLMSLLGGLQGQAPAAGGGANPQLQQLMSLLGGLQGQAPAAGGGANPKLQQVMSLLGGLQGQPGVAPSNSQALRQALVGQLLSGGKVDLAEVGSQVLDSRLQALLGGSGPAPGQAPGSTKQALRAALVQRLLAGERIDPAAMAGEALAARLGAVAPGIVPGSGAAPTRQALQEELMGRLLSGQRVDAVQAATAVALERLVPAPAPAPPPASTSASDGGDLQQLLQQALLSRANQSGIGGLSQTEKDALLRILLEGGTGPRTAAEPAPVEAPGFPPVATYLPPPALAPLPAPEPEPEPEPVPVPEPGAPDPAMLEAARAALRARQNRPRAAPRPLQSKLWERVSQLRHSQDAEPAAAPEQPPEPEPPLPAPPRPAVEVAPAGVAAPPPPPPPEPDPVPSAAPVPEGAPPAGAPPGEPPDPAAAAGSPSEDEVRARIYAEDHITRFSGREERLRAEARIRKELEEAREPEAPGRSPTARTASKAALQVTVTQKLALTRRLRQQVYEREGISRFSTPGAKRRAEAIVERQLEDAIREGTVAQLLAAP